jgi:hypothetical protein
MTRSILASVCPFTRFASALSLLTLIALAATSTAGCGPAKRSASARRIAARSEASGNAAERPRSPEAVGREARPSGELAGETLSDLISGPLKDPAPLAPAAARRLTLDDLIWAAELGVALPGGAPAEERGSEPLRASSRREREEPVAEIAAPLETDEGEAAASGEAEMVDPAAGAPDPAAGATDPAAVDTAEASETVDPTETADPAGSAETVEMVETGEAEAEIEMPSRAQAPLGARLLGVLKRAVGLGEGSGASEDGADGGASGEEAPAVEDPADAPEESPAPGEEGAAAAGENRSAAVARKEDRSGQVNNVLEDLRQPDQLQRQRAARLLTRARAALEAEDFEGARTLALEAVTAHPSLRAEIEKLLLEIADAEAEAAPESGAERPGADR